MMKAFLRIIFPVFIGSFMIIYLRITLTASLWMFWYFIFFLQLWALDFLDLSFILSFNHSLMNSLMICLLFWSHSWSKIIITCMHAQVISKIQVQCVLLVEGTVEFEWRLERTWIVINWSHEDSQLYFEGWFGYN